MLTGLVWTVAFIGWCCFGGVDRMRDNKRKETENKGKGKQPVVKHMPKKQKTLVFPRIPKGGIRISDQGRAESRNPRALRPMGHLRDETSDEDFQPDSDERNSSSASESEGPAAYDSETVPLAQMQSKLTQKTPVSLPPHSLPEQEPPQNPQPQDPIPFEQRFNSPVALTNFNEYIATKNMCFERGLDVRLAPKSFIANLMKRGWNNLIYEPEGHLNLTLVREWYANFSVANLQSGFIRVRGVNVPWSAKAINDFYRIPAFEGQDYVSWFEERERIGNLEDPLEAMRKDIKPDLQWFSKGGNARSQLVTTSWPNEWKVEAKFSQNRLLPKDNITHFHIKDLQLLYAIHYDLKVDVGKTIFEEFRDNQKVKRRQLMCPYLIYSLCKQVPVEEYPDDHFLRKKNQPLVPKPFNARTGQKPPRPRPIHMVPRPITTVAPTTFTSLPFTSPIISTTTTTPPPPPSPTGPSTIPTPPPPPFTATPPPFPTTPPPPPFTSTSVGPWLSERQGLLIAHKQRDWMDSLRLTLNGIVENQRVFAQARQIDLPHLILDTSPFLYTPEIEADLQRVSEDLISGEAEAGFDDIPWDDLFETTRTDTEPAETGVAEPTQTESAAVVVAPSSSTHTPTTDVQEHGAD